MISCTWYQYKYMLTNMEGGKQTKWLQTDGDHDYKCEKANSNSNENNGNSCCNIWLFLDFN